MSAYPKVRAQARKTLEGLIAEFKTAARRVVDHGDYLQQL